MSGTVNLTGFHLTFDDEFNSFTSSPDGTSGWQTTFYFGGRSLPSNGEQEFYSDSTVGVNPFTVQNGELAITAAPGSNPLGLPYNSGLITTEGSFVQTHGYFEIRAQLPQGQGMWPGFWLLPSDKSWPPEIDVLEAFGAANAHSEGGSNQVHVNAITSDWASGGGGDWVTIPGNIYTGYHTYGVDWESGTITYYIDGQQVYQVATPSDMNKPMYMLANLAVGGTWPGLATGETGQMHIDYIRAYSKDPDTTAVNLQSVSSPDGVSTSDIHGATTGDGTELHPGTIVLRASADSWSGDPQFTVTVDGIRIGGVQTVTAAHSLNQWQDITLTGNFLPTGPHTVAVSFINDGWGGSASTDRNLYIQSVTINGERVAGNTATNTAANGGESADPNAAVMMVNGTAQFTSLGQSAFGSGDDIFAGAPGSHTLDGGGGINTLDYSAASGQVIVNLATGFNQKNGFGGFDSWNHFQDFKGGAGDDIFFGGPRNATLDGGGGINRLDYSSASDPVTIDLSTKVNQNGFGGSDTWDHFQVFKTGAGDDAFLGGAGTHVLDGGGGINTLDYSAAAGQVIVNLATGFNLQNGFGGSDSWDHFQSFKGGAGDDVFFGGPRSSTLDGGGGINTLDYSSASGRVIINLATGFDQQNGFGGSDAWDHFQSFKGGAGDDIFFGGPRSSTLDGGAGINTLDYSSASGSVTVDLSTKVNQNGFGGSDTWDHFQVFKGGAGNDAFITGQGTTFTGGAGNDTFQLTAGQANGVVITDFSGSGSASGDQLRFIGYGSAAAGATLQSLDSTHWQINSADGMIHDVFTLSNAASIHPNDYLFT